jgi:hypothetical protein
MSNAELRRDKPILWLSVICAASTGSETDADLAPALHQEMDRVLEERMTEDAPPSMELIQALHNWMCYHYEPSYPKQRLFLRYCRLSVDMVVSLAHSSKIPPELSPEPIPDEVLKDEDTLDVCRKLLMWYWGSFV